MSLTISDAKHVAELANRLLAAQMRVLDNGTPNGGLPSEENVRHAVLISQHTVRLSYETCALSNEEVVEQMANPDSGARPPRPKM